MLKFLNIEPLLLKIGAIAATLLAMFGALKLSNKKAADAREAEIELEIAQDKLRELREAKEIEKAIDSFSDNDKRGRLRNFFNDKS